MLRKILHNHFTKLPPGVHRSKIVLARPHTFTGYQRCMDWLSLTLVNNPHTLAVGGCPFSMGFLSGRGELRCDR